MYNIFRKEITSFLSSITGYIVMGVFLTITGLFVWVFPETNILDFGYANLDPLFITAPWVFMFLVPAITMKFLSEEKKSGTLEILATKPVSDFKIILGKYLAGLVLLLFSLTPTLIYYLSVYELGIDKGNIDSGATWGSYLGLVFLGSTFLAIGIFSSSITENQIVAFITAVCLCFFFYSGFDSIASINLFSKPSWFIQLLGIQTYYSSISRGVIDSRDLAYFFSIISIFILFTYIVLNSRKW